MQYDCNPFMLSLPSSLPVKTYIGLFFFIIIFEKKKSQIKLKMKEKADSRVQRSFAGAHCPAPVYTSAALSPLRRQPREHWNYSHQQRSSTERRKKLNVKIEPGGIKGPQRSKGKIIKKQDNGVSVENELCARVCVCTSSAV